MATVIVLFNLKNPATAAEYERWARDVDLPTAGSLQSVERFEVLKAQGLFGGGDSPYQYFEILRIKDMQGFEADVGSAEMQKVAAQFQVFADNPVFVVTVSL